MMYINNLLLFKQLKLEDITFKKNDEFYMILSIKGLSFEQGQININYDLRDGLKSVFNGNTKCEKKKLNIQQTFKSYLEN